MQNQARLVRHARTATASCEKPLNQTLVSLVLALPVYLRHDAKAGQYEKPIRKIKSKNFPDNQQETFGKSENKKNNQKHL